MYQHYKGGIYTVLVVAKCTETGEERVIYHLTDSPRQIWDRPMNVWMSPAADGSPRFKLIEGLYRSMPMG